MRLYLDQMLRIEMAESLRMEGHDVLRASETGHARAEDATILEYAVRDDRTLFTLDHHFGDWAVLPLDRHPGVIRVSVIPPISPKIIRVLVPFLRSVPQEQLRNHLVILYPHRARWIDTTTQR